MQEDDNPSGHLLKRVDRVAATEGDENGHPYNWPRSLRAARRDFRECPRHGTGLLQYRGKLDLSRQRSDPLLSAVPRERLLRDLHHAEALQNLYVAGHRAPVPL